MSKKIEGLISSLKKLSRERQRRLDALMHKSNEGRLTSSERSELEKLVRETQEITLRNSRTLAEQQRRLQGK